MVDLFSPNLSKEVLPMCIRCGADLLLLRSLGDLLFLYLFIFHFLCPPLQAMWRKVAPECGEEMSLPVIMVVMVLFVVLIDNAFPHRVSLLYINHPLPLNTSHTNKRPTRNCHHEATQDIGGIPPLRCLLNPFPQAQQPLLRPQISILPYLNNLLVRSTTE